MFYIPFNLALTVLFFPYWWVIAIGSAVSGASNAFFMVGQNSYILDCASEREKGTYTGVFNFFIGISTFFGSLIMGIVADLLMTVYEKWFTLTILLFVVAGFRLLSSLGYLFIKES